MHAQGCDPSHLYSDKLKSLSNEVDSTVCDQPLSYIGTSDGYACYSGTLVGAYAVHHCLNCDYRSVRVCMADGNWNGTALQCDCTYKKICMYLYVQQCIATVAYSDPYRAIV